MFNFDDEDELEPQAPDQEDDRMSPIEDDEEEKPLRQDEEAPSFEPIEDKDSKTSEELDDAEAEGEDAASRKSIPQEINDESDDLLASLAPEDQQGVTEVAESPLNRYRQYLEDYKKLQEQRRKDLRTNAILQGVNQIAQGIATAKAPGWKVDNSGIQRIGEAMANQPVQDFEQGQIVQGRDLALQSDMAAHDPASPQSRLVRDYLSQKLNMKLPENVSAADAMLLMKTVGKQGSSVKMSQLPIVNQKTGEKTMAVFNPATGVFSDVSGRVLGPEWVRDYRAQHVKDPFTQEQMGFSGGTGKLTGPLTGPQATRNVPPAPAEGESVPLTREMLNTQQSKQLDKAREKFMQEVRDDRKAVNSADRVLSVLESGKDFGDLPAEIQDQMARAFGQTGHITDAQMGRALGRSDWKSRAKLAWSLYTQGKIDDDNREFLKEVMTVIRDQNQSFIKNKAKAHISSLHKDFKASPNLKKYNIKPEQVGELLSVEESAASAQGPQQRMLIDKRDGKLKPIKADKYDEALASGYFEVPK